MSNLKSPEDDVRGRGKAECQLESDITTESSPDQFSYRTNIPYLSHAHDYNIIVSCPELFPP